MHKSSFISVVLGYIPRSEGYIPHFLHGTIVLGIVVIIIRGQAKAGENWKLISQFQTVLVTELFNFVGYWQRTRPRVLCAPTAGACLVASSIVSHNWRQPHLPQLRLVSRVDLREIASRKNLYMCLLWFCRSHLLLAFVQFTLITNFWDTHGGSAADTDRLQIRTMRDAKSGDDTDE